MRKSYMQTQYQDRKMRLKLAQTMPLQRLQCNLEIFDVQTTQKMEKVTVTVYG